MSETRGVKTHGREVEIHGREIVFPSKFCQIIKLTVSHRQKDGTMSPDQERLVFERGNAAAVLLFNLDTNCVVLVNQFRAPTLGDGETADGWPTEVAGGGRLTEAIAGIIDKPESPVRTAIRETMEETGYEVREPSEDGVERDGDLKLIAKFFSSPGGSSELIYLYSAKVRNASRTGQGGGLENEDITVREMPVDDLFRLIRQNRIEDPKLLIGALWLQEELKELGRKPLPTRKVKYSFKHDSELAIGYITGPIYDIYGENSVSIWVNSENEDMVMDRFNGKTISASIRFLGATKDDSGNLTEDTIADELSNVLGGQTPVKIGTVFKTGAGALETTHGVDKILHVASVKGARAALDFDAGVGVRATVPIGFRAHPDDLELCVKNVLFAANKSNRGFCRSLLRRLGSKSKSGFWRWLFRPDSKSILFPIIGAGDGGLRIDEVVPILVRSAIGYLRPRPNRAPTTIKEVYFLAYTAAHKHALDVALQRYCGTVLDCE
jgi:nudix-type nucleoside diphosphatase (YffH/AdpP family)